MADKKRKKAQVELNNDYAYEWGETKQERIVERSIRAASEPHTCKGPACGTAFDKI